MECPKLIDAFRNYVNVPKMGIKFNQQTFREETWAHELVQDTVQWQAFVNIDIKLLFHNSRKFAYIGTSASSLQLEQVQTEML